MPIFKVTTEIRFRVTAEVVARNETEAQQTAGLMMVGAFVPTSAWACTELEPYALDVDRIGSSIEAVPLKG